MPQHLRVFISSPGDVPEERLRADLILDKLSQDYGRFFSIAGYRWEHEAMLASQHFQDAIEAPSKFDIVVLILWSRLGTALPERTAVRAYCGIDDRVPVTGTEWEFEEALKSARKRGAPDLLAFRKVSAAPIDPRDPEAQARSFAQLNALNAFWRRHFVDRGIFLAAYDEFLTLDDFAQRLEQSLRKLIERRIAAGATGNGSALQPIWLSDPFRGLHSYEFEHAPIFFGRNTLITKGTEQLAGRAAQGEPAFLLVCGASGTGKSSMVKAGLVPRLSMPQRISAMEFLRRVVFRPGMGEGDVFLGLARALVDQPQEGVGLPELVGPSQDETQLAANLRVVGSVGYLFANALGRVTEAARASGQLLSYESAKLILVVDQLEELLTTPGIAPEDRRLFAVLIDALARSGVVWVVATLRADFWHLAAEIPLLLELAEGSGRLDVPGPSPGELAEMIRRPAQVAGLSFEVHAETGIGLDLVIAEDAANQPGVLPLLSFTLDELYSELKRVGATMLTNASYSALGGLQGAIATRAEVVLGELAASARQALPRVLRELTTVPDLMDRPPTANLVQLNHFEPGSPARLVVDAFVAARLLVASEESSLPMLRVAHEALLTHWQRARDQLALDRRDLETRVRVERQFQRWSRAEGGTKRLLLLRDPDLANAIALARRWGEELSSALRSFIARSARRARLRQALTAAAAMLFAILAAAAVVAAWRAGVATKEAEVSLWLANSHIDLRAGRIESALDWAWRAFHEKPNGETRSAVIAALAQVSPHLVRRVPVGEGFTQALAWIDNDAVGYATSGGDLRFIGLRRDVPGGQRWNLRHIAKPALAEPSQAIVALRPIGRDRLVAVLRDGTIMQIAATDDEPRVAAPAQPTELNAGPHAAAISPDGTLIAAAPTAEPPRLYRCRAADTGTSPVCAEERALSADFASAVEIGPDGNGIAVGASDGRIEVWSGTGSQSPTRGQVGFPVVSLAWNPRGDRLAVGGADGTIAILDAHTAAEIFPPFPASSGVVSTLGWSPSGVELAFVCNGKDVCIAALPETARQPPTRLLPFIGHGNAVARLAWSPDGASLASADVGHEILLWSLAPDRRVAFDLRSSDGARIGEIASLPGSHRLAGAREEGDIAVWDTGGLVAGAERGPVTESWRLHGGSHEAVALAWRADGSLIVGYRDGAFVCWSPNLQDPPRIAQAPWEPFQIAFAGHDRLAAITANRELYLMDAECRDIDSAVALQTPDFPAGTARAVATDPDGSLLPVSYDGGKIALWDPSSKTVGHVLPIVDPIAPLALSVSPHGRRLATTGGNEFVKVFELERPAQPQLLKVEALETGGSVAFGPDGKLLAAIGADDRVYVWQLADGAAAELLLRTDPLSSRQFGRALAWLGPAQLAFLRPEGVVRVLTLDHTLWRQRLDSLQSVPLSGPSGGPR